MAKTYANLKNEKKKDSRISINLNWDKFKENRTRHIPV